MTDFALLDLSGRVRLEGLVTPACLLGRPGDLVPAPLTLEDGRVSDGPAPRTVDLGGRIWLPAGVDMHTHLDKGHIWPRRANPDGTFTGALDAVREDRAGRWSAEDVRARMEFSLACAYAHGTRAIRTHLDSLPPQDGISWPVFAEVRADWADRIALQAVNLVPIDMVGEDTFADLADRVAAAGGVLGAVAFPINDIDARLDAFFRLAAERGLAADLHVDETLDPGSDCLRRIAEAVTRTGFDAPVVAGHCCSLSTQAPAEADRTLDLVARAGIGVVSLPMCNLYLQDRHTEDGQGRTPRYRGITLVHEMRRRGIRVAFASDNTRDPFYAYGDLDLVEVLREATRIGHLDHSRDDWPATISAVPEALCGFPAANAPGAPLDAVLFNARTWTEFFARPQADRIVIRGGAVIRQRLPDYSDLDPLMEPA